MIKVKGLFAVSLIAILMAGGVAVNSAVAAIASKGYVDQVAATHVQSSEQTPNAILTTDADGNVQATAQITQSQVDGLTGALNAKADTTDIPTKTSQLNNDSGFITSGDLPGEYELPVATADALGGVKSGGDITVNNATGAVTVQHADSADTATSATTATTATTATKATQDASGNVITTTYAKKSEIPTVNNGQLTINVNGTPHSFTANQAGGTTVDIDIPDEVDFSGLSGSTTGSGNVVTDVTQTNGKVSATKGITAEVTSNKVQTEREFRENMRNPNAYPSVPAVYASVASAMNDKVTDLVSSTSGTGAVVTAVSQTDGKVSVTRGNVRIPYGSENATSYATIWVE